MKENMVLVNDTQLVYYEQRLQSLIGQEVSQEFSLDYTLTLIALLLSIGALVLAFIQMNKVNTGNDVIFGLSLTSIVTIVVLLVVLGYSIYAQIKYSKNKNILPKMIEKTQNAIETYKTQEMKNEKNNI